MSGHNEMKLCDLKVMCLYLLERQKGLSTRPTRVLERNDGGEN
jgi:hypothetical protein